MNLYWHYNYPELILCSLSFSRLHSVFTIFVFRIHYKSKPLYYTRIRYELTFFYAHSIWILYQFLAFTICRAFYTMDPLCITRIHCEFIIFPQTHYLFSFYYAYSKWIHYLFLKFNLNKLSFTQNHYWILIASTDKLWIRGSFISFVDQLYFSWISLLFYSFFANQLVFSRIHYGFTINYANSIWIHNFVDRIPINSLSF